MTDEETVDAGLAKWGPGHFIRLDPTTGAWAEVRDGEGNDIPPEDWQEFYLFKQALHRERLKGKPV